MFSIIIKIKKEERRKKNEERRKKKEKRKKKKEQKNLKLSVYQYQYIHNYPIKFFLIIISIWSSSPTLKMCELNSVKPFFL